MIDDIEIDPRIAGQVTRYHTWPRHRDQSVGEHSWQIIRILLTLWPAAPRKMLVHATFHDANEMVGDIPYPGKKRRPELKKLMSELEAMNAQDMRAKWSIPPYPVLNEYEQGVFKLCEYLEMWEYGLCEQNLGNRYGAKVAMRMLVEAAVALESLEPPSGDYPDLRPAARRYVDARMKQKKGRSDMMSADRILERGREVAEEKRRKR